MPGWRSPPLRRRRQRLRRAGGCHLCRHRRCRKGTRMCWLGADGRPWYLTHGAGATSSSFATRRRCMPIRLIVFCVGRGARTSGTRTARSTSNVWNGPSLTSWSIFAVPTTTCPRKMSRSLLLTGRPLSPQAVLGRRPVPRRPGMLQRRSRQSKKRQPWLQFGRRRKQRSSRSSRQCRPSGPVVPRVKSRPSSSQGCRGTGKRSGQHMAG